MNTVKVIFENPEHNYITPVSDPTNEESARKYFVGRHFDVERYPKENRQKCIDIEFTPMPENLKKAKIWWRGLSINEQRTMITSILPPNTSSYVDEDKILTMFNNQVN